MLQSGMNTKPRPPVAEARPAIHTGRDIETHADELLGLLTTWPIQSHARVAA